MALVYDGGVVMGADSRTSTGTYIANRVADKITPLHDRIFCCRSGSAADTQAIADYVRYFLASNSAECGRLPTVKTAAHITKKLCYENKDALMAGMIIAGWDPSKGGSVYEIPLGGTLLKRNYGCSGSGSTYIYGLIDAKYKDGMTREEAVKFTKYVISHAMARDGSSGGVIRIAVINKEGVSREVVPGNMLPYGP
eukprot:289569_1